MNFVNFRKLTLKEIIFNLCFAVSTLALFNIFCNTFSNVIHDDGFAVRFVYSAVVLIVLVYLLFVKKIEIFSRINLKKSKVTDIFTLVFFVCAVVVICKWFLCSSLFLLLMLILGAFALLVLCYVLFDMVHDYLKDFFASFSKFDLKIFVGIIIFGAVSVTVLFFVTTLFSTASQTPDAFFNYDTSEFRRLNWYFNLFEFSSTFNVNDFRHILLSVSMMPFVVVPYALSLALPFLPFAFELLLSYVQVILIAFCTVKILSFLKISENGKFAKVLITLCMLFSSSIFINMITIDKYVISLFYIILSLDLIFKNSKYKWFALAVSVGNLTTNLFLVLIALFCEKKKIAEYFKDLGRFCLNFFALMLLSGQILSLIIFVKTINFVTSFSNVGSGEKLNFLQTASQWLISVATLYLVPNFKIDGVRLIQSDAAGNFMIYIGIVIFALQVVSVIVNRKEKFAWVCFAWQVFMFVLLALLGWGSALNEMFIYSALFAWSSFSLLVMLFKKLLKNKYAQIAACFCIMLSILIFNAIQFAGIMRFAVQFYPA